MSISGIRDMSLILEVPKDRFPIQTYLMPFEIEKVKYAIEKEVSRGGQVYYVYNRVGGIENITDMLSRALPEVSFTYCHGQMSEKDIENRISEFIEKKFDVLISTTIIETGMDLENVNTIIMHNATQLGLSQLYQLRGRVGRSNQLAYCYLFYPSETIVTQEALNRLETIREYTDFGSGYKIALRDLELRGAGSIIGAEQSGHFEQIGYELYMQLLTDTIKEKRNVESPVRKAVKIDIPISAFIREDYINNESVRVHYYHRLSNIESYEELIEIENELIDRFGTLPLEVSNLIELSHLRYLLIKSPFNEIKYRGQKIVLKIDDIERIDNFIELAQGKYKNVLRFKNTVEPSVHFMIEDNRVDKAVEMTIELLEDYFKV